MKLLAFVDLHGSEKAFRELKKKVKKEKPAVIVCAGDISVFGKDLKKLMQQCNALGKPLLIIPGNHEDGEPLEALCNYFTNVHYINEDHCIINNVLFLGYEAECFSQTDPRLKKITKHFLEIIAQHKGKKIVTVHHAPPFNTAVDRIAEEHAGNKTLRKFIEKIKPVLVVCGHLHENFGKKDKIGTTTVINPGPTGTIVEV